MQRSKSLGSTEFDVLRHIGEHHPIKVADVADHMARTSGQARTTILTTMERLRRKGYLTRKQIDGAYHYSPKIPLQDVLSRLVKSFVNTTLGGSVSPFLAYLSESEPISDHDLAELKQVVRTLEARTKGDRK